ncbi:YqcI/YcgG family protein [Pseudalkalibacillus berkeleyi]|uniref:YqcI/YcgG family protein n=1 Tax=Pseudalkalibacillus berkeleyi TaxID=1069813 RepID=A0ABS9GX94_9BACL|nr:YqcI/YcgG family protein [Pseudalkalibacillus berkeleyi]MCF6136441.1 YqcI/YcgG family protein [Pseudalkalibacillus berkeleyi]
MAELYTKSWLEHNLSEQEEWQKDAFHHFASMIADPENTYPCIPGRQGFLSDNLRFGFTSDPRNEDAPSELASLLKAYGETARTTGKYASLVVFFKTPQEMISDYCVEDFESLFWSVLNRLSAIDEKEWPANIPTDPSHHEWEFCFNGEPYFAFCATPAHIFRKSRSFPCFMMAFQPRWVFDEINDSTVFGRKMKKAIRKRLSDYDHAPIHPDLKWYGQSDNHEWKQYFLSDDEQSPSKCPYTYMKNKLKSLRK